MNVQVARAAARQVCAATRRATAPTTVTRAARCLSTDASAAHWRTWTACNAVCFDVDSTVITEEGIDVMAEFFGKGPEVAAITRECVGLLSAA